MVRLIRRSFQNQFRKNETSFFDRLARLIVDHPQQVRKLIASHSPGGRPLSASWSNATRSGATRSGTTRSGTTLNGKQLMDRVFGLLAVGGVEFQEDLAVLLARHVPDTKEEDHFLGALTGAVSSVSGLMSAKQDAKVAREQASTQTLQSILAYKAQKEAQAASLEAAKTSQAHQQRLLQLVGGGAVVVVVGWIMVRQLGKRGPTYVVRQAGPRQAGPRQAGPRQAPPGQAARLVITQRRNL